MSAIKQLGKMIGAAIVAVIILSLIIFIYNTSPLRVKNPQGNTDYVWKPDSLWSNMSEGVSFGKMDGNGFNNLEMIDNPDIILLGSSHIESKNVNQNENTSYYLAESFDNKYTVYNMGMSGHTIYKVCYYLPETLSLFQDHAPKYVIIETDNVSLTQESVDDVLNHSIEKAPVYDSGIIVSMQKIPVFRQIYNQLDSGMTEMLLPEFSNTKSAQDQTEIIEKSTNNEETMNGSDKQDFPQYDQLMSYLEELQEQYNTKIIILFHPYECLNEDGSISFTNNDNADAFDSYAKKHNITFLNMADRFEKMYNEEHHAPHGFITGEIAASAHLNKYGHKAIADGLYDTITGLEG